MPEVQIERESFLQSSLRLDEEEQVSFPIFGDFLITGIGVELCFEAFEPFLAGKNCSHVKTLLKTDMEYCTIAKT
jgi:hypothetical protein